MSEETEILTQYSMSKNLEPFLFIFKIFEYPMFRSAVTKSWVDITAELFIK